MKQEYPDVFLTGNLVRLCRICEKEFNISHLHLAELGWDVTHGICIRHFVKMLHSAGTPVGEIKRLLKRSIDNNKLRKSTMTRDLRKPGNEDLVKWLQQGSPYQKQKKK